MLAQLYCKRLQSLLTPNCKYVRGSAAQLCAILNSEPLVVVRLFSSTGAVGFSQKHEEKQQEHLVTLTYFINSCGLSPESAVNVSKYVNFKSSEKPDSVLRLLRDHGLSDIDISKLIKRNPPVLLANSEKILLPKLEFLQSVGVSGSDLAKILYQNPSILTRSLQRHLIPAHDVLKSLIVVDADKKIVKILKMTSWCFLQSVRNNVVANASVLREHGMPESIISQLVSIYPCVMCRKVDDFEGYVKVVMEMGFTPSRKSFVHALKAVSTMSKSTWEYKMEIYKRWGWSQDEILLAFKKHPMCMMLSEKKISGILGFLTNKMGWQPSTVAQVPTVLTYSLEKRIIPRCSVIKVLLLKGLVNKSNQVFLSSLVISSDKYFLDTFVTKYLEQVPQLLNIIHGKTGIGEISFEFEQKCAQSHETCRMSILH